MKHIMVGAWEYPQMQRCEEPKEALEALHEALKTHIGVSIVPVFYLGRQIVSGMNYAFLCEVAPMVLDPDSELKVVVVYRDPEGNCCIDRMYNAIQNRQEPEADNLILQGGWEYPADLKPCDLPQRAASAFTAASGTVLGVDLEPVFYIGQQLVSGMNYAILCKAKSVTTPPKESLKVVIIYETLQGPCYISRIYEVIQSKAE